MRAGAIYTPSPPVCVLQSAGVWKQKKKENLSVALYLTVQDKYVQATGYMSDCNTWRSLEAGLLRQLGWTCGDMDGAPPSLVPARGFLLLSPATFDFLLYNIVHNWKKPWQRHTMEKNANIKIEH